MKRLKKILQLTDPYPNVGYEISCYLKAFFGFILVALGFFFLLSPLLKKDLIIFGFAVILAPLGKTILVWEEKTFSQNFTALCLAFGVLFILFGLWVFWQIKIVRKFIKTLEK